MRATCSAHPICFDLIIQIIFDDDYIIKLQCSVTLSLAEFGYLPWQCTLCHNKSGSEYIYLCSLSADALASCQRVDNEIIMTLLCLVSTVASVNFQHVDMTKYCHCCEVPLIHIEKIVVRGLIFFFITVYACSLHTDIS